VKVVVYPADRFACGHFRMIWPGEMLAARGLDVEVINTRDRRVRLHMDHDVVKDVEIDADVVVFQRLTHMWMRQAVPILRAKGVAVVIDVDDDLSSVHPSNPAWGAIKPGTDHSWHNLADACRNATLVTVSAPALLPVYASHGRGHVLHNYLPAHYYGLPRTDSELIGWPASIHSHPNDPDAVGGAVARIVNEGARFRMFGDNTGAGRAFGLSADPDGGAVEMQEWPRAVSTLGIGIAPLADTKFNRSKSWLKPLEMSACGVPWVASPRPEYVRLNRMGAGVLAERPRVWYRELKRMRESAALRQEMSAAGREVAAGLQLVDHVWRWEEAWKRALDIQHNVQRSAAVVM
jgi:hypothetical protein